MTIRYCIVILLGIIPQALLAGGAGPPWTNEETGGYAAVLDEITSCGLRSFGYLGDAAAESLGIDLEGMRRRLRQDLTDNDIRPPTGDASELVSVNIVLRKAAREDLWLVFVELELLRPSVIVQESITVRAGRPKRNRYLRRDAAPSPFYRVCTIGEEREADLAESLYLGYIEPLLARFITDFHVAN